MNDLTQLQEQKRAFAKCLADGLEPMKAAFKLFPSDHQMRMKAGVAWQKDAEVIAFVQEIVGVDSEDAGDDSEKRKSKHIDKLNAIFDDEEIAPRDRLTASMQIAQMEGFIAEKVEKNTTINNRVMIVTRSATDEDWEKAIVAQQEKLVRETLVIKQIDVIELEDD